MPRYFTLPQAEQLLRKIENALREAASLKPTFDEVEQQLRAATQRILMLGGALVDRHKLLELRQRRDGLGARLKELIEEIQEHGCLVKDLDMGLIDFPARYRGREVYLCWKLGEARIAFWHEVEAGYRGRQPIDKEFLEGCEE